ncbi:MAG: hypothetical protein RLZZ162_3429, partial [Verrucomicrobiota bacterium]
MRLGPPGDLFRSEADAWANGFFRLSLLTKNQATTPRARDSFAFVNEVNGSFRKSGFPVLRGCFTTALPSASERNEVG